jgi:hypothetical protein
VKTSGWMDSGGGIRTRDLQVMSRLRGVGYLRFCRGFREIASGSERSNLLVLVPVWYPFSGPLVGLLPLSSGITDEHPCDCCEVVPEVGSERGEQSERDPRKGQVG